MSGAAAGDGTVDVKYRALFRSGSIRLDDRQSAKRVVNGRLGRVLAVHHEVGEGRRSIPSVTARRSRMKDSQRPDSDSPPSYRELGARTPTPTPQGRKVEVDSKPVGRCRYSTKTFEPGTQPLKLPIVRPDAIRRRNAY